mmetsp:Transcript_40520/g.77405  ORF Transcript_40520/g.77405 Transcript_40520/m.77405 type:complete len:337 (-) Transcript_40520:177-1187(-)
MQYFFTFEEHHAPCLWLNVQVAGAVSARAVVWASFVVVDLGSKMHAQATTVPLRLPVFWVEIDYTSDFAGVAEGALREGHAVVAVAHVLGPLTGVAGAHHSSGNSQGNAALLHHRVGHALLKNHHLPQPHPFLILAGNLVFGVPRNLVVARAQVLLHSAAHRRPEVPHLLQQLLEVLTLHDVVHNGVAFAAELACVLGREKTVCARRHVPTGEVPNFTAAQSVVHLHQLVGPDAFGHLLSNQIVRRCPSEAVLGLLKAVFDLQVDLGKQPRDFLDELLLVLRVSHGQGGVLACELVHVLDAALPLRLSRVRIQIACCVPARISFTLPVPTLILLLL